MPSRRAFLAGLAGAWLPMGAALRAQRASPRSAPEPRTLHAAVEGKLRAAADRYARPFPAGGQLRLAPSNGAFAGDTASAQVVRGAAGGQAVPGEGLLTFAVDVSRPAYVSGELALSRTDDLRPGLRACVLCDTTLVAAPMVAAPDWGIQEITDAAPRVAGRPPARTVPLNEFLLPSGRHYLTIAGPHFRSAGIVTSLTLTALPRPVEDPLYSFAFISDTHLAASGHDDWMNRKLVAASGDELRRTLASLASERSAFVLHGGDMTESAIRPEFEMMAAILDGQPLPVYGCMGNHDVYLESSRDDALELLGTHFPGGTLDYTFTHGPIRFVVMDVAIERPELKLAKQEWLKSILAADRRTPTIFVWHYAPYNRAGTSQCGFRLFDWSALGKAALLDVIQSAPNVFATLNGHDHWDEVNYLAGITHVQNAAFVEWPNAYRMIRIYPDRLEWEVRQVANRGFVRESCLPRKAVSWMIATRDRDTTGRIPLLRGERSPTP